MVTFYQVASSAAMNIDVASPECSFSVSYIDKWNALQSIPLITLALFLIGHVLYSAFKRFAKRQRGSVTKHLPKLMSWWLLIVNILYLVLFRKVGDATASKIV